ncbi:endolysin [Xanthomonas phage XAJ2]|uniref:Lysozyme n=1 Tax=Xanthomonas phage XAJ2 TaxID=1775249 RepID=A0A1I9L2K1_9CAUD|nr:endolysin [Xanthomonas phage XAJ2]
MSATPSNIEDQLRRDEGEKLSVYQDSLGFYTIGIGVLIDARKGGGITKEESSYLFQNRLKQKEADLAKRWPHYSKLDPVRKAVLLNMSYQMGVDGVLGFRNTLQMIETGRYEQAAAGMLNSKWAVQTPARAKRLSEQMRTGKWQ